MDKTMTQVRDEIRLMNGGGLPTSQQIGEWADAIDAAIKARAGGSARIEQLAATARAAQPTRTEL